MSIRRRAPWTNRSTATPPKQNQCIILSRNCIILSKAVSFCPSHNTASDTNKYRLRLQNSNNSINSWTGEGEVAQKQIDSDIRQERKGGTKRAGTALSLLITDCIRGKLRGLNRNEPYRHPEEKTEPKHDGLRETIISPGDTPPGPPGDPEGPWPGHRAPAALRHSPRGRGGS